MKIYKNVTKALRVEELEEIIVSNSRHLDFCVFVCVCECGWCLI